VKPTAGFHYNHVSRSRGGYQWLSLISISIRSIPTFARNPLSAFFPRCFDGSFRDSFKSSFMPTTLHRGVMTTVVPPCLHDHERFHPFSASGNSQFSRADPIRFGGAPTILTGGSSGAFAPAGRLVQQRGLFTPRRVREALSRGVREITNDLLSRADQLRLQSKAIDGRLANPLPVIVNRRDASGVSGQRSRPSSSKWSNDLISSFGQENGDRALLPPASPRRTKLRRTLADARSSNAARPSGRSDQRLVTARDESPTALSENEIARIRRIAAAGRQRNDHHLIGKTACSR